MSPKPFAWKDRDSAARDLIQLVYHGTEDIRSGALDALSGIRSSIVVDELKEIVLSQDWTTWNRIYALRAICAVPSDVYFPELRTIAEAMVVSEHSLLQQSTPSEYMKNRTIDGTSHLGLLEYDISFMNDIASFVEAHSSNKQWFFEVLDRVDPAVISLILRNLLMYNHSAPLSSQIQERLLAVFEANPQYLDGDSVNDLYNISDPQVKAWLEQRFNEIVQIYLSSDLESFRVPTDWLELTKILSERKQGFAEILAEKEAIATKFRMKYLDQGFPYKDTDVWQRLNALNIRAAEGDNKALGTIKKLTRGVKASIPICAAATHFLGKLQAYNGVTRHLCSLLQYNHDRWDHNFYSPIRVEAGDALKNKATPEVWEAMLNTFFLSPDNMLETYLIDWFTVVTDVLSGEPTPVDNDSEGNGWPWRAALAHLDDNLEELGLV